ncbi:MAG: hypothetical protein IT179_00060 [Acidobacteria bacterium]|nr:hypothetical protein [Acidobacteriota bacterium]
MGHRRHFAVIVLVAAVAVAGTTWRRAIAASPDAPPPVAPDSLMDTGLYAADRPGVVDPRNRPFSPQYPLWTDGASKARWIYLPPGTAIDTTDVNEWDFPVGTKLWKEFGFRGRAVETRWLWRATRDQWVFASYVWNADGTAAVKAPDDGVPGAARIAPGRFHDIPSVHQCRACHVSDRTQVLGFNALQLSTDRDPNAIHGEPLQPGMTSLKTLNDEGLLQPARPALVSNPPRIIARSAGERAVLGYLAGNCGACHNRKGDLAPLGLFWKHGEVATAGADTARAMIGHETKWQVPGVPEGESVLVDAVSPQNSALLRRMTSRFPASQMPPLGTVVRDQDALEAVARWIASQRDASR